MIGPPDLLLAAPPSADAFLDRDFIAELYWRGIVMASENWSDDRIEPEKVRARDAGVFACEPSRSR